MYQDEYANNGLMNKTVIEVALNCRSQFTDLSSVQVEGDTDIPHSLAAELKVTGLSFLIFHVKGKKMQISLNKCAKCSGWRCLIFIFL